MSFTKLHTSLLDSTIWRESDQTRILWITLLAMSDQHGTVEASIPGLADRARLTISATQEALGILMAPDQFSRTKDDDGRRISEIDGGWMLTNYAKYRERADPAAVTAAARERKQRQRDRLKANTTGTPTVATTSTLRSGFVYYVAFEDRVKIALSKNPWARVKEMPAGSLLVAQEAGDEALLSSRIAQFMAWSLGDGWFRRCDALIAHFHVVDGCTTECHTTSRQAEAEAEAEQKGDLLRKSPVVEDDHEPTSESGFDPGELPQPGLELVAEGDGDRKGFPWRQLMGALKRICPEIPMPAKGERRDFVMQKFWKQRGKTVGSFEILACQVQQSDFLMARGGHTGNAGKPYSWGWIFTKDTKGFLRADRIMAGEFANERMAWVLDKRAKEAAAGPKLTKVVLGSPTAPVLVDLAEKWDGKPRYRVVGDHAIGLPEVLDQKVA